MISEQSKERMEKLTKRKYPFILASRVPEKTFIDFTKLSNEEFCGDNGMTIKHLLDNYLGIIYHGTEHLEIELQRLNEEIEQIKKQIEKPSEPKGKKMMDGRIK